MKKSKNNNNNKVVKRLLLGPASLFVLSLIYPYSAALFTYFDVGERSNLHLCTVFPVYTMSKIVSALLIIHMALIFPIFMGWVKSAVYLLLISVLLIFLGSGGWVIMMAYVYLLCEPVPYSASILVPSILIFILLSTIGFLAYWKPRMDKVIKLNPGVYDFNGMKFYCLRNLVRLDGKDSTNVAPYVITTSALSAAAFSKFDFSMLHSPTPAIGIGSFVFALLIGYAIVGIACVNQLYIAWHIYKMNKILNGSMQVAELMGDK